MATYQVTPPETFSFAHPQEWPKWIRRFERFRAASGLSTKEQDVQVNTLIYSMGDMADDILKSFGLSEDDSKSYAVVKGRFDSHFVKRRNIIYERAKFNMRKQRKGESSDSFITDLYTLVEYCDYRALREEMIRDRLVVGLLDAGLSEKLQLDADLTLEKAITKIRNAEAVKSQQSIVRGEEEEGSSVPVGAIKARNPTMRSAVSYPNPDGAPCSWCGFAVHDRKRCPAKDATCRKCGKPGHFQRVCKSSSKVGEVHKGQGLPGEDNTVFLGKIGKEDQNPWVVDVKLDSYPVTFHIDTGAEVTVISDQVFKQLHGKTLVAADRTLRGPSQEALPTEGKFWAELQVDSRVTRQDVYVVAGLHQPLLGRPAIEALNLLTRIGAIEGSGQGPEHLYPQLFSGLGKLGDEYTIRLREGSKPFALNTPRRVAVPLMPAVRDELHRMEQLGVISSVEEPTEWCAPMVVVPKSQGRVRICVDLTRLNESVCRERHQMPAVEQTLAQLAGARIFSKLDANSGFWQIPLSEESSKLTTFITPFGRYSFNRLPFGITSAPEHFQRRMSAILAGLEGVVCLVDDVLVYGKDQQQHDERLNAVLQRLAEVGLTLNREKCRFSVKEVDFLGQILSEAGVRSNPDKIAAIAEMKDPTNVSEVRRFLGMANQLGKFTPHLADMTKSLRDLLSKNSQWCWEQPQRKAFASVKEALTSSPVLALYDPGLMTTVSADASSYGLGAVLLQRQSGGEIRPVAYVSRSMTATEERYAQIEKEALALTWACERFADYLVGLQFHIETDHKPLVPLLGQKSLDELPIRVQRFRMRLMRFCFTISHVPGRDLSTADTLSRAPTSASTAEDHLLQEESDAYIQYTLQNIPETGNGLAEIRRQQEKDEVCRKLVTYCSTTWPDKSRLRGKMKKYYSVAGELSVQDGLLLRGCRLVIPEALQGRVLNQLHEGHQGILKCRERARQAVWWPGLSRELEDHVTDCQMCCQHRSQRAEPLIPTPLPDLPWQKVATDLFEWNKSTYLLIIDYYSRWIEIARLERSSAECVVNHTSSIFARHGIPEVVVSDNGPQYTSDLFRKFASEYGFKHVTSSPYHPQGNGEAERGVQTVKNLLKKAKDPYRALMAYRATPLDVGYSPSELLMSRKLRTTLPVHPEQRKPEVPDFNTVESRDARAKVRQKANFDSHRGARDLPVLVPGDSVWVSDRKTPGQVIEQTGERSYLLRTPEGVYRRNRSHAIRTPNGELEEQNSASDSMSENDDAGSHAMESRNGVEETTPSPGARTPAPTVYPTRPARTPAPKVYPTRSRCGDHPGAPVRLDTSWTITGKP